MRSSTHDKKPKISSKKRLLQLLTLCLQQFDNTQKRDKSETFAFWDDYTKMVQLLLHYLRAERDDIWRDHLDTTASMLPYVFAYSHINYARWVTVYIADMKILPQTAPDVHAEFTMGNFGFRNTERSFNQVWSDAISDHT